MPVFNNILAGAAGSGGAADYTIKRSLRFEPGDSAYLNRTASAGSNTTWTLSTWLKKTGNDNHIFGAGAGNTPGRFGFGFDGSDKINVFIVDSNNTVYSQNSAAVFRDPSAWYHIVVVADTTNSTAADRLIVYVNGVRQTLNGGAVPLNQNTFVNTAAAHAIGRRSYTANDYFDGYLADVHFIDGQALAETDFGAFDADTGVWNPKKYSGTYGTNGFHLDFSDNSSNAALGFDANVEGTRYSADCSGALANNYTFATLFDGNVSTLCLGANGSTLTFEPATPISWIDAQGGVEVYYHNTSQPDKARINGGSWVNQANNSGGWEKVSTGNGTLTKLELKDQSSSEAAVYAIRVNGTILTDPSGANDWTVNNLIATGVGVGTAGWPNKIGSPQSTYDSAATSSTVSSGTSWSTNGNNNTLHFDTQALGTHTITFTKTGGSNDIDFESSSSSSSGYTRVTNSSSTITISSTASSQTHSYSRYVRFSGSGGGNVTFSISGTAQGTDSAGIDSLIDSPTNYEADSGNNGGNYCTWNPLDSQLNASASLANGNLEHSSSTSSSYFSFSAGTIGFISDSSTGFYFEVTQKTYGDQSSIGLHDLDYSVSSLDYGSWIGSTSNPNGISYTTTGTVYNFGSTISSQGTYTNNGDVIGVAVKDNKIWFSKNGTWISGNPSTGAGPTATLSSARVLTPIINGYSSGVYVLNAGQRPFAHTPPTGFKSLCTQNLDESAYASIADGSDYFYAKLYTGNGSTQNITGYSFSPDLVWTKQINSAGFHALFDPIRGVHNALRTHSNGGTYTDNGLLTAFNSDGFSVGSAGDINSNNNTYVGWAWEASSTTVSNTDGTITSQVRANPTAGFSIVKFTGPSSAGFQSVGHGLNAKPEFIICKDLDNSRNWSVYHKDTQISDVRVLPLNQHVAAFNSSTATWDISEFSTTTFTPYFRDDYGASYNADNIAYCFAPVEGYSAFGKMTGNQSANGPFVYTGFRPAFILTKGIDDAEDWYIRDTSRSPFNVVDESLRPNDTGSEYSGRQIDILSNGFKIRTADTQINENGKSYLYAAFAENPFKTARAR